MALKAVDLLQLLMNVPTALGSLYSAGQSQQLSDEWRRMTEPSRYLRGGWLPGGGRSDTPMMAPGRVDMGIADFLAGYLPEDDRKRGKRRRRDYREALGGSSSGGGGLPPSFGSGSGGTGPPPGV